MQKQIKRLIALAAVLLITATLCPAMGAETIAAAPLTAMTTATDGTVRVWLKTLAAISEFSVTVRGDYSVNGDPAQRIADGTRIGVRFSDGSLVAGVKKVYKKEEDKADTA